MRAYYSIDLSKKAYISFMAGLLVVGILIYVAGVITGIAITSRTPSDPVADTFVEEAEPALDLEMADPAPDDSASDLEDQQVQAENPIPEAEPHFTIQIGAFLDEENAVNLFDSLKMKDYDLHLFTATDTLGRTWYNVRIGFYPDFNKASMAADSISRREDMPTMVRPLDKL